ncbi:MAG: F-box protein, partial [Terriglobus roseus]|nr:F-box protein [Terriglobus roseus]
MRKRRDLYRDRGMSTSVVFSSTTAGEDASAPRLADLDRPRAKSSHVLDPPSALSICWNAQTCDESAVQDEHWSHPSPPPSPRPHRRSATWVGDVVRSGLRRASFSLRFPLTTRSNKAKSHGTAESVSAPLLGDGETRRPASREAGQADLPSAFTHSDIPSPCLDAVGRIEKPLLSDSVHQFQPLSPPPAAVRGGAGGSHEGHDGLALVDSSDVKAGHPYLPTPDHRSRVDSKNNLASPGLSAHSSPSPADDERKLDPITHLPAELMAQILAQLDVHALTRAEHVSRMWREAASSPHVWRQAFLRRYEPTHSPSALPLANGGFGIGKPAAPEREWKRMYQLRRMLDARWHAGQGVAIYLTGHTDGVYCVQYDEQKIITGS